MNRDSNASIIPKIILILGTLSVLGIFLLFFRPRSEESPRQSAPESPQELFTQVIAAGEPRILELWEEGDTLISKEGVNCPDEIANRSEVGKSYYQCQPHLWQCYWQGGVKPTPEIPIKLFGKTYHIHAHAAFDPIPEISSLRRFYQSIKRSPVGINLRHGYVMELKVKELPEFSQRIVLADTCRDAYLPQRIYGYGQVKDRREEGFIWDNFGRNLFIDKFYVSNQKANEWFSMSGQNSRIIKDPVKWPYPALLSFEDQQKYCGFFGKRVLEAKLFDAATMSPADISNGLPDRVMRPQTPWQRDLRLSFLGMAQTNPEYQLTPLDCQLAQVEGCPFTIYETDSATWMGIYYALGFFPESLKNNIEPEKNLKLSSRFIPVASRWHELGVRGTWDGVQSRDLPVAFRCYEEVIP